MSKTYADGYMEIADALRTAYNTVGHVTWPYGGSIFQQAVLLQLRKMLDEAIQKLQEERGGSDV